MTRDERANHAFRGRAERSSRALHNALRAENPQKSVAEKQIMRTNTTKTWTWRCQPFVNAVFSLDALVNRSGNQSYSDRRRGHARRRARYDLSPWTGDTFSLEGDDEKLLLKVDERRVA